jgi:hypothetical protein
MIGSLIQFDFHLADDYEEFHHSGIEAGRQRRLASIIVLTQEFEDY